MIEYIIDEDYESVRVDRFLRKHLKNINLSEIYKMLRKGKIKNTFSSLGKLADITIYNKTKGLFDAKTLAGTMLLIYGIKKFKNEMFLPSGATLIWWAYRLLSKKGV